ncbi:MAG: hypothetical protein ABIJ09_04945 [Pseudomonadota bacterium]
MRPWTVMLLFSAVSACVVEHATDDGSYRPVFRDAAGSDAAAVDAGPGHDASGTDLGIPDSARPDSAARDQHSSDSARPDSAVADATTACSVDDSYEPNDIASEATPISVPVRFDSLVGCDDDWYSFTAPAGSGVEVKLEFVDAVADLDLYLSRASDGSSIDSSLSTTDDELVQAPLQVTATPMRIRVRHFSGSSAPYALEVRLLGPPANDTCAAAESVTLPSNGTSAWIDASTTMASDSRSSSTSGCQILTAGSPGPDLFYTFVAPATGFLLAELWESEWQGVISVFESCGASTELACGSAALAVPIQAGHSYVVAVDAKSTGSGEFSLDLRYQAAPTNDTCAGAKTLDPPTDGYILVTNGHTGTGTDTRSATSSSEYCQATARFAPDLYYTFMASRNGTVRAKLNAWDWDASMYVLEGGCGASTELVCNGEFYVKDPLWYRFDVVQGQTYVVVVDGYADTCCSPASGSFEVGLGYYIQPATLQGGETCAQAVPLVGSSGTVHGTTETGVNDLSPDAMGCNLAAPGNDTFYKLTLAPGQSATITLQHGDPYKGAVLVTMRADCPVRGDSCLDAETFSASEFATQYIVNSGTTAADYFVVVDAYATYYGEPYDLKWTITGP